MLPASELRPEYSSQRFLLTLLQTKVLAASRLRLPSLNRNLSFFPPIDLVHTHLSQRHCALLVPPFQVAQVDRLRHRRLRQVETTCHLADARSQASPTISSNRLPKGAWTAVDRSFPTRTLHSGIVDAHLHNHRRAIDTSRQILISCSRTSCTWCRPTTSPGIANFVTGLCAAPASQCLRLFVQFVTIQPVPRRQIAVHSLCVNCYVPKNAISSKNHRYLKTFTNSLRRAVFFVKTHSCTERRQRGRVLIQID